MLRRFFSPMVVAPLFLLLLNAPARAQFNVAVDYYKTMLGYADRLKEIIDNDAKRADYSAVASLGTSYFRGGDNIQIALVKNAGLKFNDSNNQNFLADARSGVVAAAEKVKKHADLVRSKGEAKQDCKGDALNLQEAMKELDTEMKKSHRMHEEHSRKVNDAYISVRDRWWDASKDDRKPLDELAKKVASLGDKRNELQTKANQATKLYLSAQDECDRARSELYRQDKSRSPDEVKSRYEAWSKAEDLVKRVAAASAQASKEAAEVAKAHIEAENELAKAQETYTKEAAEADALFKIVLQMHARAFEFNQEYKPFSW